MIELTDDEALALDRARQTALEWDEYLQEHATQPPLPGVEVQAALEGALARFAEMETRRWAGWVLYLLEGLEELRPAEIEGVLQDVKADIETRLLAGRW